MEDEILQVLEKCRRLKRGHATFYNWHDKQVKESGIVDDFLDPDNHKGMHGYVSFSIPEIDPPDAVIYKDNGEGALLEISELVNQDAIEAEIKGESTYSNECRKWTDQSYFETQLNARIQIKNRKCAKLFGGNSNVQLLLHTDEMWLESSYKEHLNSGITIQSHGFTDIWIMLSYSPGAKSQQIIQVCKYAKNV